MLLTNAAGSIPALIAGVTFIVVLLLVSFLCLNYVNFIKEGFMTRLRMAALLIIGCFTQFLSAFLTNAMSSLGSILTIDQFILAMVKSINTNYRVFGEF